VSLPPFPCRREEEEEEEEELTGLTTRKSRSELPLLPIAMNKGTLT